MAETKDRGWSILQQEGELPDFSFQEMICALYFLQQWEALEESRLQRRQLDPYASGYFYRNVLSCLKGLNNPTRETALKHLSEGRCVSFGCDRKVDLSSSQLDHIIPRAVGGSESLTNALVLCRPHNSSKGTKDFLVWWMGKGFPAPELSRRILALYCRATWQFYTGTQWPTFPDPLHTQFLQQRCAILPSHDHRLALYGATYAALGFWRWEHTLLPEQPS